MSSSTPQPRSPRTRRLIIVTLLVVIVALAIGGLPRLRAHSETARQTALLDTPSVTVIQPTQAPAAQTLTLPGDVQAYQAASIYARTSGYVRHWYTDIGTQVRRGQLLADIESPEVDAQLIQARADEASALANADIARATAQRWATMFASNAVSRQANEEKNSAMKASQATLGAARANVLRLAGMQSFEKVTAPFAGVISARDIDTGSLINAGSGTPAALFQLMQSDRLRVFINVPQDQAADVVVGAKATITLPQRPQQKFVGAVARTADAINPNSRTLRVEVDMDNPNGTVLPGAFANVSLALSVAHPGLSVPTTAVIFRPSGPQVAVVNARHAIELRPVSPGRDFGATMEILSGLTGNEQVVLNPADGISNGDTVRINPQPSAMSLKPA